MSIVFIHQNSKSWTRHNLLIQLLTRTSTYFDRHGQLSTRLYDKRDDVDSPIVNFPFMDSNVPASPTHGVFMSQLIRYSRACSEYPDFHVRSKQLVYKLISQGFDRCRLIKIVEKFYGRHHDLIRKFSLSLNDMRSEMFDTC